MYFLKISVAEHSTVTFSKWEITYLIGFGILYPERDHMPFYNNHNEELSCSIILCRINREGLAILEFSLQANRRFCFRSGRSLSTLSAVIVQVLA